MAFGFPMYLLTEGGNPVLVVAVFVFGAVGWPGAALHYAVAALIGLVGILVTRETWGPQERAEVAALLREEDVRSDQSRGSTARVR